MLNDEHGPQHACRCLNVRIQPLPPVDDPPCIIKIDSEYSPVYVGQEGIFVTHPQLTLRTRSKLIPLHNQPSLRTRFTSLTCLVCQLVVYRVHQTVSPDVEGKDGPVLPTDDWVEIEILMSSSGWIGVHNSCLSGESLSEAASSDSFSDIFSLVLPAGTFPSTSPDPKPHLEDDPKVVAGSPRSGPPPEGYLSHLRALFPPPPFTPSHPVFVHLSSIAASKAQSTRVAAEEQISQLINAKIAEVERAESALRLEVEILWKKFCEAIDCQRKKSELTNRTAVSQRKDSVVTAGIGASLKNGPVSVTDFVPVRDPAPRSAHIAATSASRISSLSASLATSRFHHPRAASEQLQPQTDSVTPTDPPPSGPASPSSARPRDISPSSSSQTRTASTRTRVDGGTSPLELSRRDVTGLERDMDKEKDLVASFTWFTIEAEMAKRRKNVEGMPEVSEGREGTHGGSEEDVSAVTATRKNVLAKAKVQPSRAGPSSKGEPRADRENAESQVRREQANGPNGQENGVKGKRKVTFDVEPDKAATKKGNGHKVEHGAGEMMFDLDDEGYDLDLSASESSPQMRLTFVEPPRSPIRRQERRSRGQTSPGGLPESFSRLRPASLPAPSHMRPSISPPPDVGPSQSLHFDAPHLSPPLRGRVSLRKTAPLELSAQLDEREAELRKLVAADTPSHRGAWNRDSKAWQMFIRRQGDRTSAPLIPEETDIEGGYLSTTSRDEYDESEGEIGSPDEPRGVKVQDLGVPSSAPITIAQLHKPRPDLSLASYAGKVALSDRPSAKGSAPPAPAASENAAVGRQPVSADAYRRAAYAERDLTRSMDPGTLDFDTEADDDRDGDGSDGSNSVGEEVGDFRVVDVHAPGKRGRERALKILQACSELPEEGMWRSLAT